ncbi:MAG: oxidoreductase [Candidatus Marinimicrobia bacterium]|nr:oxidoreductase [Candidatus Neomarinimicrobiota bacterium]|tara:strand:+ start:821 stop:1681 length:861 start_codon:yes stop_codon:yes gene_type:complete
MKNILITGVSTGIGKTTAEYLLKSGYRVFGSIRKVEDAKNLIKDFSKNFIPLKFDITDEVAIIRSVEIVKKTLNGEYLDFLINNAGAVIGGPSILLETQDFRNQFEINLFSVVSITNAFIKLLGAELNNPHEGKIINISSVSGKRAFPFLAPYAASKFALEGYSDALRRELQIYGIDVILIEPGPVKTAIWNKVHEKDNNSFEGSDYDIMLKKFSKIIMKNEAEGINAEVVSKLIYKIINSKYPRTRYLITKNKFKNHLLIKIIPERWLDKLIGKKLGLLKKFNFL